MKIKYASVKLEKSLTNQRLIKKAYNSFYKNLINRLSELEAVGNLSEISIYPPPRRHKLTGIYEGCWGIDCSKNYRIIIKPIGTYDNHDIRTIQCIEIICIEDYH